MIMKKMVKLTAATRKNYETGQIHGVKGCSHRLIGFVWELSGLIFTPVELITSVFYLYTYIGVSFLFGISLLVACFMIDRRVRKLMHALHFENGKAHEKCNNLTNETFESMKTIKLYGWDQHFHTEIRKLMHQQREHEEKIHTYNSMLNFMW